MDDLRSLLTTYAYNITGSYEDSKDVVQDAYLKFMNVDKERIENKKAYLIRTVINLAINFKNRQKKLVSEYPGTWLPEPVATEKADTAINRKEILSYSLMVLLEKLNAKQRAVFILKEAFGYEHEEIAEVLGITTENSRKLLSRAKTELKNDDVSFRKKIPFTYINKYATAIRNGDMHTIEQILNDDITLVSDGGGKVPAAINFVKGKADAIKFLQGVYKKFYTDKRIEKSFINHQPALLYYNGETLTNCQVFFVENDHIHNIYFVRNPDKLRLLQENVQKSFTYLK
jgi:RNA polymerase sigma-70 factor (ECF subfamily)